MELFVVVIGEATPRSCAWGSSCALLMMSCAETTAAGESTTDIVGPEPRVPRVRRASRREQRAPSSKIVAFFVYVVMRQRGGGGGGTESREALEAGCGHGDGGEEQKEEGEKDDR